MIAKKRALTKEMPAANYIMGINQNFGKPYFSLKSAKVPFIAQKNVHSYLEFF